MEIIATGYDYIRILLLISPILIVVLVYLLNCFEIINFPSLDRIILIKERSSIIMTLTEQGVSVSDAFLIQKHFAPPENLIDFDNCEIILIRKNEFTKRITYIFYFPNKNERLVINIKKNTIQPTHQKLELHKVIVSDQLSSNLPPIVIDQLTSLKKEVLSEISNKTWLPYYVYWEAYADNDNVNIRHGKIIKIGFLNRDTEKFNRLSI